MSRQQFNAIGEKMFKELCAVLPKPKARDVVKLIEAQLIRDKSSEQTLLADKICAELRGKFSPNAARSIVCAAERAAQLSLTRQAIWQRRQVDRGNCPKCGERCDFNSKTSKPFHYCATCRAKIAPKQAMRMRKRRVAKANVQD